MAKVVLIGTSHKYQTRGRGVDAAHVDQFGHLLTSLCSEYTAKGIAEEMNHAALAERGISETVAQAVSTALGIKHQLSDPPPEIRQKLGVCGESEIRVDGFLQNWSPERIEIEVRKSHNIRELYWLAQLKILNSSPVLFVCGAHHLQPFSALLRNDGFEVVVAVADWVPSPSLHRSARKAAQAGEFQC